MDLARAEAVTEWRSHAPTALVLTAIVCSVFVASCASGREAALVARPASSQARDTLTAVPSASMTGDTDGDDEANARNARDGDNDDSKPTDKDNDSDGNGHGYFDADDARVRRYGHAASQLQRKAIAVLIWRYYEAAVAGDGVSGCWLIAAPLSRGLPQILAGGTGPRFERGVASTCPALLKAVFVEFHRQLAAHLHKLTVSDVRVEGSKGEVTLAFKSLPGRFVGVIREGDAWKVDALVDSELP